MISAEYKPISKKKKIGVFDIGVLAIIAGLYHLFDI